MSKKKTTEEFKKEVYEKVDNEYTVLGDYINNQTKILMMHNCDKCNNYEYKVTPAHFLNGSRCPKCFSKHKKTTEEFKKEVYEKVGCEYTVLGEYIATNTKILMRHNCDKCNNYEYGVSPNNFLNGNKRCPICYGNNKKTTEEFKTEVYNKYGNEYTVLGEYKNNKTKILMRHNCNKCNNYEYKISPHRFLQGDRCPKCNKLKTESDAIKYIKNYLNNRNILFEDEKLYDGMIFENDLKIDIVFNNINIEYDGDQHFKGWSNKIESKLTSQSRDKAKNDFCLNNQMKLIRIPYIEENNLDIILDAIIDYNEDVLIKHNCLIIDQNKVINKPMIYNWYNEN